MPHPKEGYRLADGTRVPGTTTIIGRFKDSGGLLYWACEQGKAIERGEISKLYDRRDSAGESGTLGHSLVEAHINGQKFDIPEDTPREIKEQAEQAFEAYLSWAHMTKLEILEQEMELVSEEYRFGGCPDAIGRIGDDLVLLDWKTSNSVYQDYLIQLAAYKQLWEENHPDQLLNGFHLCRFAKQHGDFAHYYFPKLEEAWRQFVLFREAYDIDKQLKKRV